MMQQRGELLLLIPAGCCPHPFESWYTLSPARCPACAILVRVPLGQTPSLHALRRSVCDFLSAPLFGHFVGTTRLSDSPAAFMWVLRFMAFTHRPASYSCHGRCWGLPVLAHEVSKRAWGLRLRRVRVGLA